MIQEIQYVLAPAVMVSSSALLILGLQNKFSSMANRLRSLNAEKRLLARKVERDTLDSTRILNIQEQVARLGRRSFHIKNAIVLAYASIISFTSTSILIFLDHYIALRLYHVIIVVFLLGLMMIFLLAVSMIVETMLFYSVIRVERES